MRRSSATLKRVGGIRNCDSVREGIASGAYCGRAGSLSIRISGAESVNYGGKLFDILKVEPYAVSTMVAQQSSEIQARIEQFVSELEFLIRKAALASVEQALQSPGGVGKSAAVRALANVPMGYLRPKGSRRTADDLEEVMAALLGYIKKNPGQRMEQLADGMGLASKELTLPIKKLHADGRLKTKGQKRATAYFIK